MRAKIDITEVEAATKIRAKYLRALENEEWDLLPGPTFVKSFLRTYARLPRARRALLVEEYKLRYERPSDARAAAAQPQAGRRGASARRRAVPAAAPLVAVVRRADRRVLCRARHRSATAATTGNAAATRRRADHRHRRQARRTSARRTRTTAPSRPPAGAPPVLATGAVWVCLVDGDGTRSIAGRDAAAPASTGTFTAGKLHGDLRQRRACRCASTASAARARRRGDRVGYDVTPAGARCSLPPTERPDLRVSAPRRHRRHRHRGADGRSSPTATAPGCPSACASSGVDARARS